MQKQITSLENETISLREKVCYGFGDVASCFVYGALGSYMLFFFTDVALIGAAAAASILLLSKAFDGVSDIIAGWFVDNTESRWGKARPYLLWYALPFGICAVLLFTVPNFSLNGKIIYAFISYNVMTTFVYTAINVPYGALASMMTKDVNTRATLSVFRASFGAITVFVVSTYCTTLVEKFGGGAGGWQKTFILFGTLAVIFFLLCFFGTKERVLPDPNIKHEKIKFTAGIKVLFKNKYWAIMTGINICAASMSTLYGMNTYFAKYVVQDISKNRPMMLCATFALIVVPFLCIPIIKKIGKWKVSCYCGAMMAFAGQMIMVLTQNINSMTPIFLGLVIRGIGIASLTATKFGMITDCIEYGEWKTGLRTEGFINSACSVGIKIGSAVTSAVIGYFLAAYGYNGALAVQTATALKGIRILFYYAPLVVTGIMVLLLCFYHLDKEYPMIIAELDKRHEKPADNA